MSIQTPDFSRNPLQRFLDSQRGGREHCQGSGVDVASRFLRVRDVVYHLGREPPVILVVPHPLQNLRHAPPPHVLSFLVPRTPLLNDAGVRFPVTVDLLQLLCRACLHLLLGCVGCREELVYLAAEAARRKVVDVGDLLEVKGPHRVELFVLDDSLDVGGMGVEHHHLIRGQQPHVVPKVVVVRLDAALRADADVVRPSSSGRSDWHHLPDAVATKLEREFPGMEEDSHVCFELAVSELGNVDEHVTMEEVPGGELDVRRRVELNVMEQRPEKRRIAPVLEVANLSPTRHETLQP
mmetsp:Transcript_9838/g.18892  ORF Transcript_9838/g.18892 Transcript_9838/m.18892 type:complete len:295 (-) Transcript_9838:94-978(-)